MSPPSRALQREAFDAASGLVRLAISVAIRATLGEPSVPTCQRPRSWRAASDATVASGILFERHQQSDDRLLADLHRARDAALLQLARLDQIATSRRRSPPSDRRWPCRRNTSRGRRQVRCNAAGLLRRPRRRSPARVTVRSADAVIERDHLFLHAVVGLHVQQRDDVDVMRRARRRAAPSVRCSPSRSLRELRRRAGSSASPTRRS